MSKKQNNQNPEESVENALNITEKFLEKNKKLLIYSFAAVLAIASIGFAYQYLYRNPLKEEAKAQTFVAEQNFRADSFDEALNGDGNSLGFADIINEYGSAAPKSVYMYAGICELHLGNFDSAISYLRKYKTKDPIMQARAYANIGDAYAGLQNNKEALSFYKRAASHSDNIFAASYMLKAGIMQEELGDIAGAIKTYEQLKIKYPQSAEGMEADKYIARLNIQ